MRQDTADIGKDPDQREIQLSLNSESKPAGFVVSDVQWDEPSWTDQRIFLLCLSSEDEWLFPIDQRVVFDFADGKGNVQGFNHQIRCMDRVFLYAGFQFFDYIGLFMVSSLETMDSAIPSGISGAEVTALIIAFSSGMLNDHPA